MAQEIDLKLKLDASQADASLGSLKSQLKAAQQEVQTLSDKFGATSREAVAAAQNAAQLKDRIGDAKNLTDAFNPDAKFKSLTSSLTGAAGAMSVVTGATAIFGEKNKEVEQALLKVQAAMAISSGLQAVGESIDAFKQLKAVVINAFVGITAAKAAETTATEANIVVENQSALSKARGAVVSGLQAVATGVYTAATYVATTATAAFNAVMLANPIAALIASIAALVAGGYFLIKMFMDSAAANESAIAANKKSIKITNDFVKASKEADSALKERNDQEYAMAKATGESAESLRKMLLKRAEEAAALKLSSAQTAYNTYILDKNTLATLRAAGASDDAIKGREDALKASADASRKETEGYHATVKAVRDIRNKNAVEVAQEQTDARNKASDHSKSVNDDAVTKAKEAADKKKADKKALDDEILKLEQSKAEQLRDMAAKTEQEKLDLEAQRDLENIERLRLQGGDVTKLLEEHNKIFSDKDLELQDKLAKEKLGKDKDNRLLAISNELQDVNTTADRKKELLLSKSLIELEDLTLTEEQKKTIKINAANAIANVENDILKKAKEEKLLAIENELADDALSFEAKRQLILDREAILLSDKTLSEQQKVKITETTNKSIEALEEAKFKGQQARMQKVSQLLSQGADLLGKNTAEGKALAVAAALINTYQGITAQLAAKPKTPYEIGLTVANVAIIAATGFKSVKDIMSVQVPGGGGGGSAGGGSMTPPAAIAPSVNVVGASQNNQIADTIGRQGQQPIKAFVVANDVSTQQGLDRNIVKAATLG